MGNVLTVEKNVFHWEYTEEPHKSRRLEILSKHPEIKKLIRADGDRRLVWSGLLVTLVHISLGFVSQWLPYAPARFLFITAVGSWFGTSVMLHLHEAAHGLVFGPNHVWKNRLYGLAVNTAMGLPFYSFFKKHHKNHHKSMGDEILDAEYPSELEAKLFSVSPAAKWIWMLLNPLIFGFRVPLLMVRRFRWSWDSEELLNLFVIVLFDLLLIRTGNCHVANYLFCSALIASQSNMFGFWGLMSHTEFLKSRETSSYYGWLNGVYLNFGYHVEHHDFPGVPCRFLPEVRKLAPEYYEDHFVLDSFVVAAIKFIFDDKVGVSSRLRRENALAAEYSLDGSKNYRIFTGAG